ncbi:Uncharacterized protein APZ42_034081 [Daphnia magna]|uniref:Uncharacterized protein n=1 Tax=Daphnia magna TaxID=35525 RepID=A0A164KGK7_9CRUS|nr:Uncharacterized protein APZ42_034081 [Daphnia magna]
MKIFIMTIFLAAASAGPVPKAFGIGGMRQLVPLPGDFIVEQLPVSNFGGAVSNFGGAVAMNGGRNGEQQGIQLMLTVPSAVPPGTSVSVTVNVNSEANEPPTAGLLPDEVDQREPPMMFLPPFENSKDSPVLVAMQGEAQQQQLAALLQTKTI